jgi:hypothetical protein
MSSLSERDYPIINLRKRIINEYEICKKHNKHKTKITSI